MSAINAESTCEGGCTPGKYIFPCSEIDHPEFISIGAFENGADFLWDEDEISALSQVAANISTEEISPSCKHGKRELKPYQGKNFWVCGSDLPKGDPNRCDPVILDEQGVTQLATPGGDPEVIEVPEEAFSAAQDTEGSTAPEGRGPFGLKERNELLDDFRMAAKGQHRLVNIMSMYVMRAHGTNRTAYISTKTIAERTGIADRHVKDDRKRLVDHGWLVDTGRRMGPTRRTVEYRVAHGREVPPMQRKPAGQLQEG